MARRSEQIAHQLRAITLEADVRPMQTDPFGNEVRTPRASTAYIGAQVRPRCNDRFLHSHNPVYRFDRARGSEQVVHQPLLTDLPLPLHLAEGFQREHSAQ